MVDVENVLLILEQNRLLRTSRRRDNWYAIYCPFHSNGQEKRPSCGVLLHDEYRNGQKYPAGMFHCFACGAHKTLIEAVSEILKQRSISKSGYDWLVENIDGFSEEAEFDYLLPAEMMTQLNGKYAMDTINRLTNANKITYVSEEELASYRFTVPYMYERKLTDEAIELYDVGYDANWIPPGRKKAVPCITFPVRDAQKRTLFLCRRSIEGKLFNYPTGVTKPLYGIDVLPNDCRSIIICESVLNAITAHIYGYQAVALLGTGNAYQMQQLKELGVNEFVICTDGDDAGQRAAEKLKRQLQSVGVVWTIHMPPGKDLNDCSKEEFDQLYASRD